MPRETFAWLGYQATRPAVIAERGGVSERLQYRQAGGKQKLFVAVVAEVARRVAGLPPQDLAELEQWILRQFIDLIAAAADHGRTVPRPTPPAQAGGTDP